MAKRMLIDTSHPEETRVAVVSGNRLEEFDYESAARKQLKGNIYLAKVTRVEPSLQAAFVEYGGNRHGFLPFSEIHPDYYRIPIADREALLAEEASHKIETAFDEPADAIALDIADGRNGAEIDIGGELDAEADSVAGRAGEELNGDTESDEGQNGAAANGKVEEVPVETGVDTIGGDEVDDAARRRARFMRRYKIQEVIKRRQVLLIQVTKEERGNKGAALTTYLSLAGRYCVLMPNTARGGGISRKISSAADRRRLKSVIEELDIPEGIAVIVRTAGSQRSKPEIRRDYDYLLRLWNEIRETTLGSTAPSLIYEEASLIKRAIRDLYRNDMDEILVDGEDGHKAAKAFMKTLMPSHARNVKLYKDPAVSLFQRNQVEGQIDAMHSPIVQLKSGGYIVINVTEALVAIDVNSGKATRGRHIEETAYKTNLEASDEVARQLRLRDLAGLIVIDFIDMEESRHNRSVERRLKDALRSDRARIQLGRISPFGLLEMSRQRLRPSLVETSTSICPTCKGIGHVRTTDSSALHVMRVIEEDAVRRGGGEIAIAVSAGVAMHLLNNMRARLVELERLHGLTIRIDTDDDRIAPDYRLERLSRSASERAETAGDRRGDDKDEAGESDGERRRGRGRRRRGGDRPAAARESAPPVEERDEDEAEADAVVAAPDSRAEGAEEPVKRRRRRGKRGGRRRGRRDGTAAASTEAAPAAEPATPDATAADSAAPIANVEADADVPAKMADDAPEPATEATPATADAAKKTETAAKKKSRSRRTSSGRRRNAAKSEETPAAAPEKAAEPVAAKESDTDKTPAARKPRARRPRKSAAKTAAKTTAAPTADEPAPPLAAVPPARESAKGDADSDAEMPANSPAHAGGDTAEQSRRRGWWQRWG